MLRYLGRYTHRVAISNHRLLSFDGERVTFRWKDYAHGNKQKVMTLEAPEFLRRFVQHILPRGFVRIRQFGIFANGCRTALLTLSRKLIGFTPKAREPSDAKATNAWQCPQCHAPHADRTATDFRSTRAAVRSPRQFITPSQSRLPDVLRHACAVVCLVALCMLASTWAKHTSCLHRFHALSGSPHGSQLSRSPYCRLQQQGRR